MTWLLIGEHLFAVPTDSPASVRRQPPCVDLAGETRTEDA